jgi:hypothetical protein
VNRLFFIDLASKQRPDSARFPHTPRGPGFGFERRIKEDLGMSRKRHSAEEIVNKLRDLIARKLDGAPVFRLPSESAAMLREEMAAARAAWIGEAVDDSTARHDREQSRFLTPEDDDGRVADFHAIRHSTGAWASRAGASPKQVQRLMRHSTITLMLDTYGHLLPDEERATVNLLPDLRGLRSAPLQMRATGTDGAGDTAGPTPRTEGVCSRTDRDSKYDGPRDTAESPEPASVDKSSSCGTQCRMPEVGLEPTRVLPQRILNPSRLMRK